MVKKHPSLHAIRRKRKQPVRRPSSPSRTKDDDLSESSQLKPFIPRADKSLKPVLQEIGVPDQSPFVPDPFQIEALKKLETGDVIVAVPTGAGKTWVAVQAMKNVLARGGRAWYASPLKALSNSKYIEFSREFGEDQVGLLTGDHKVNPEAAVIVGTTEILRNQLYDAMNRGESLASDLVIMDEAHYLGDPERGVVWEEVIIYLPWRVRLLLLSATVANAAEIADWLRSIRDQPAHTVLANERPVPLIPLFLLPDGELTLLRKGEKLGPRVKHFVEQQPQRGRRGSRAGLPLAGTLRALGEFNLLPAIFFLKSRADCDLALAQVSSRALDYTSPDILARRKARINELIEKYPHISKHPHLRYLSGPGLASHHAGHLPHWKLIIEHLMQEGLLTAIFSTSTVAAGVNFPARTVVISQSDRFNGREFSDLTATELLQMTGRAGRRGMDHIGFALVVPGPFQDVLLINSLLSAAPDPVISQIHINFSMALNLLLSHRPPEIRVLLERSLADWQRQWEDSDRSMDLLLNKIKPLVAKGACTGPDQVYLLWKNTARLTMEAERLTRLRPRVAWETALAAGLTPGRLINAKEDQVYCVLEKKERRGRPGVMAAKVREDLGLKKGRIRQKWLPLNRIDGLLDKVVDLYAVDKPSDQVKRIRAEAGNLQSLLPPEKWPIPDSRNGLDRIDAGLEEIHRELQQRACSRCLLFPRCLGNEAGDISKLCRRLDLLSVRSESSDISLWTSFLRHLNFLASERFVTMEGELTEDGVWASQLRLDHPLLFAEGIRAGAWPHENPALLAAMVALFVVDKEQFHDGPSPTLPFDLAQAWLTLQSAIDPLLTRLNHEGFATPRLNLSPGLAIHTWAVTSDWDEAVRLYGQDPGDMAMLVFRTADNLRQMAGLSESHARLAATARAAVDLIMKEPVIIPL
jgi:ATP-dependent RNA helicase HelY